MNNSGKKRRICAVTSNRADYVKLKPVLDILNRDPEVDLSVVVCGSHLLRNYDNTVELIRADGFPIAQTIYMEVDGRVPATMAKSAGLGTMEFATAFHNLKPEIAILHGDRFETLAAAIAASLMNIFIVHIEGGEVSGTIDEHIRHAVTKLAHFHFPATRRAYENIIKLGEQPPAVQCVGCPGIDHLLKTRSMSLAEVENTIQTKYIKENKKLDLQKGFILCIQHPVTTEYHQSASQIKETLAALAKANLPVIMLWPNIDAGADDISQMIRLFIVKPENRHVTVGRNFSPDLFFNILRHAGVLVGNSSVGMREAGYFGVPVVNIGTRQKGRERGRNVIDVNYHSEEIFAAMQTQLKHGPYEPEQLYGDGRASEKICRIIKSLDHSKIQKQLYYEKLENKK
jgi:UDP-hydrolysing UDP-N-acetyl-D-glucosamine 2-epimerase